MKRNNDIETLEMLIEKLQNELYDIHDERKAVEVQSRLRQLIDVKQLMTGEDNWRL